MQNIVPMSRNFLELRQGQQLTLTPALQQSIKLLQLSTLDLEAEVARALAENPLLEQEGTPLYEPGGAAASLRVGQESAEFDSAQSGAERGQDATP
jgi:RNA polymerase sigma-54 factor